MGLRSSGIDFHPVAIDTADNILPAIRYILGLRISPAEKRARIAKVINLIGSDFYTRMFEANSEVFDSTAIGTTDYLAIQERVETLAIKLVRQYALHRPVDAIVREFYDSALGKAQEEAFLNAISLDKHPTVTRTLVGETCAWCRGLVGTHIYPDGKYFARHDNCDCLIVASGYKTRNGVVQNYVKHKNTPARQRHLEPTLKKLYDNPNETTIAFSQVLEGQKKESNLGMVRLDAADALGVKRKAEIKITRSAALHMDNSGHFRGTGFTKNGHNDTNPLTIKGITNIPEIVRRANQDNTIAKKEMIIRGKQNIQRFYVLGDVNDGQIVIVDRISPNSLSIVTSYKVSKSRYVRYLKEIGG